MKSEHQKMAEEHIYEYISKVDFSNPNFELKEFKKELAKFLGIEPGVKLKWDTKQVVNELLKDSGAKDYIKIIDKVTEIAISYIDPDDDKKPIEIKFII